MKYYHINTLISSIKSLEIYRLMTYMTDVNTGKAINMTYDRLNLRVVGDIANIPLACDCYIKLPNSDFYKVHRSVLLKYMEDEVLSRESIDRFDKA